MLIQTNTVLQVVTEQRLAKQGKNPLTAEEFVVPLSKLEPIYRWVWVDSKTYR